MSDPAVFAEPILVGREKELDELQSLLDSVTKGNGKTVFVSGEAGSGKTRLAHEFLAAANKRGAVVLSGWCLSDANVPYFPFLRAFDRCFFSNKKSGNQEPESGRSSTGSKLVGTDDFGLNIWLAGASPLERTIKPEMLSPQVWKDQLFDAVGKMIQSLSAKEPLILFIEDLHWADSASLALLHFVSRTIGSQRILVLATLRSEELTSDVEGRPHPLAETLRLMRREDLFTEIKLSNLNHKQVSKVAENMIGGTLQLEFAEKLAKESRGNPLFIVESLRMLHDQVWTKQIKWLESKSI